MAFSVMRGTDFFEVYLILNKPNSNVGIEQNPITHQHLSVHNLARLPQASPEGHQKELNHQNAIIAALLYLEHLFLPAIAQIQVPAIIKAEAWDLFT